MPKATITAISNNYYLITLPPPLPGFDNFISVWLKTGKPTFIVDAGPAATADALKAALYQLGIKNLDYIFLTHIHMDHAGGAGQIAGFFPDAQVVCHPKAIAHLADPGRLWEGSLKTLGDIARAYGEMAPIAKARLLDAAEMDMPFISAFITPGHAPHHVSFMTPDLLFAGEACGVHMKLDSGRIYQRPATPPKFFMETSLQSIDLLMGQNPENICFGHYGMENDALHWLASHKQQLHLWKDIIAGEMEKEKEGTFYSDCVEKLVQADAFFAPYAGFGPDTKSREYELVKNSIQGFMGYLNAPR